MAIKPTEISLQCGTNVIRTGDDYGWALLSPHGMDDIDYDVSGVEYADLDGGYIANERYPTKDYTLKIVSKLTDEDAIAALYEQLIEYIAPEEKTTLTVYRNGIERSAACKITSVKHLEKSYRYPPHLQIKIFIPDPWFYGVEIENTFMSKIPMLTFPWNSLAGYGITSGVITSGNTVEIENEGQKAVGFTLTITATGTVVNPRIDCSNGDYIKINRTLTAGEVLFVSTVQGAKRVKVNDVSFYGWKNSKFFELPKGSVTLTLSADSGVGNMTKSMKYKWRYRGI